MPVTCLAGKWLPGVETLGGAGTPRGSSSGRGISRCVGLRRRGGTGSRRWRRRTWTARTTSRSRGAASSSDIFFLRTSPRAPILAHRLFPPFARSQGIPHAGGLVRRAEVVAPQRCSTSGWTSCEWREYQFLAPKNIFLFAESSACCRAARAPRAGRRASVGPRWPSTTRDRFGSETRAHRPSPLATPLASRDSPMLADHRAEPCALIILRPSPATLLVKPLFPHDEEKKRVLSSRCTADAALLHVLRVQLHGGAVQLRGLFALLRGAPLAGRLPEGPDR